MCAWPTNRSASDRRRRATAISTFRPSFRPPPSPASMRSIPATGSCPRTRASPKRSRRTASPSSAPRRSTSRMMGDKIVAKQTAKELGLPLVPGSPGPVDSLDQVVALGTKIGWPVLIKAVAGGGGRGMKVVDDADGGRRGVLARPRRSQGRLRQRFGLPREVPRPSAPHRDPGAGRRHGRRRASGRARLLAAAPPPEGAGRGPLAGAERRAARQDRRAGRGGGPQAQIPRRRHHGIPVPGRRILLHRDEHPPAGRASDHRGGDRHRSGARADPHRRRRVARHDPGRHRHPGPRHRMPHQCRAPGDLRALPRPHHRVPSAGRAGRAGRFRACTPATSCRPTTIRWWPS